MSAWDDLSDAARELICERSELDIAEDYVTLSARHAEVVAELAALHEGEEPYEDERLSPTPGQWIWRWNRATPAERLARAEQVIADWSGALALRLQNHRVNEITTSWSKMTTEAHQHPTRAEQVEAQLGAVRMLHHDDHGLCHACTGSHGVPWPCPTITAIDGPAAVKAMPLVAVSREDVADWAPVSLPQQPTVPTLAAMAELATAARAEHDAEQQHLEASIRVTAWVAKLTVRRTEPVEQIAGAPAALARLTAAIAELASGTAPTRSAGLVDWLTSAPSMPLVPDDSLPPGEIHLRPHPRPATS